ncbi:replication initiation and membrane attachment family protein [Domibacillus enclensis]|uniref:Replication initiation and membrane attachment protein n=1 Tax=Domibacillus enclensis TaxID=1017273 RepID=A0A1N6Q605_9BACI|nr:DnaD domain protein [Domibacillus enclensis]OXS80681.1 Replication initiation and membrane attachment protein [Domibacillus enclensis]SIQ12043.1 replicative DNA helicase loader DnaB [Domibacillus enclensis]
MNRHWNEMQPADVYRVSMAGCIDSLEQKVITLLYQPLIGASALSLYMTMYAEVEDGKLSTNGASHYDLMNTLGCGPQQIYEERLKLEGIGLLKTYVKKKEGSREFLYELLPPLSPDQFFTDGLLNVFLYRKIGKAHFLKLKKLFCDREVKTAEFQDVTHAFPDVFSTGYMDTEEAEASSRPEPGSRIASKETPKGPSLQESFDFGTLELALKDALIPVSSLTPFIKETIKKLAFLYGIAPIDMKNLVLSSINEQDEVDVEELRKTARNAYQFETGGRLPDMTPRMQAASEKTGDAPKTQEEKLILHCETVTPYQMMIDISNKAPSSVDMKLIEQIMLQYDFTPGVMNALIQYVMLKSNMKLSKSFMDKIAAQWARKKIESAKQAIELAKEEQKQSSEWAAKAKQAPKSYNGRKTTRTEKLPSWFTNKDEGKDEAVDQDFEEEKRKLEEALRNRIKGASVNEKN